MKNLYLNIYKTEEGNIEISSCDGVFNSLATRQSKESFQQYCDEKADMCLNSTLGNFDGWTKQKRKAVADKWLAAKDLPEGEYKYYFNLGDIKDLFREEVAELAKSMGIESYELIIK